MTDFDELNVHSFIVKIWLEKREHTAKPVMWRGNITHVASGQREYLHNLESISTFITGYLEEMGVGTVIDRGNRCHLKARRWVPRK